MYLERFVALMNGDAPVHLKFTDLATDWDIATTGI